MSPFIEKLRKFLVSNGYLNTIHSHDWPMVARPLPLEHFYGDEGVKENEISISKPLDFHTKTYVRANIDVLKGESSTLYNDGQTMVFSGRILV